MFIFQETQLDPQGKKETTFNVGKQLHPKQDKQEINTPTHKINFRSLPDNTLRVTATDKKTGTAVTNTYNTQDDSDMERLRTDLVNYRVNDDQLKQLFSWINQQLAAQQDSAFFEPAERARAMTQIDIQKRYLKEKDEELDITQKKKAKRATGEKGN